MSRRPRAEMQFGSDAFLDVIANIVGILIILIVIAGMRVSETPVLLSVPVPVAEPIRSDEPDDPGLPVLFAAEPPPPAPPVPEPPRSLPVEPPQDLVEQAARLQRELQALTRDQGVLGQRLSAEHQAAETFAQRLQTLQSQLAATQSRAGQQQLSAQQTAAELAAARKELADLVRQVRQLEADVPAAETLEHRINPISRVVTGDERHYRVEKGRVAEVPIEKLAQSLREQIERRKDSLLKLRQYNGEAGPIDGFTMKYLVERGGLSVLDELKFGPGMYRIAVTQWRIEPDRNMVSESIDEALSPGSRFYTSLLQIQQGSALTFWIYPDSFAEFRRLQKFGHEHGFMVAGRPLPDGVPIMGSPNGTKSSAQ